MDGVYAIEVAETGGPEVLSYVERPEPSPGPGEVLIKAEAVGVNFIDTYFRSGLYPRDVPFIVGSEVCGTVAAVGDDVAALAVGDRVVTANATVHIIDQVLMPPTDDMGEMSETMGETAMMPMPDSLQQVHAKS